MALAAESPAFEEFVQAVAALQGEGVDREWLREVWTGASEDLNRAINHVIDAAEVKRAPKAGQRPSPKSSPASSTRGTAARPAPKPAVKPTVAVAKAAAAKKSPKKKESAPPRKLDERPSPKKAAGSGDSPRSRPRISSQATAEFGTGTSPPVADAGSYDSECASCAGSALSPASLFAPPQRGQWEQQGVQVAAAAPAVPAWGSSTVLLPSGACASPPVAAQPMMESSPLSPLDLFCGSPGNLSEAGRSNFSAALPGGMSPTEIRGLSIARRDSFDLEPPWQQLSAEHVARAPPAPLENAAPWHLGPAGRRPSRPSATNPFADDDEPDFSDSGGSEADWWHMSELSALLANGGAPLESLVSKVFREYCPTGRAGLSELDVIAKQVAAVAKISIDEFNDLAVLSERYDFNGDGTLDLFETLQLMKSCLRALHSELDPVDGRSTVQMQLPRKNVEDFYIIVKKMGEGGQGSMYLVRVKSHPEEMRCVKFYDKRNANAPVDDIKEEFQLMRSLASPLVARTFEIFEDRTHVYLVNEPYFGGNLSTLVARATDAGVQVSEAWFQSVLLQPVHGICYLNQQYVMHCDLKEANIMVATGSNWARPRLVLIDFGLATKFTGGLEAGGTPGYIPPETWQRGYWVPKGDVFSLGVIFFHLLAGISGLFSGYLGPCGNTSDVARCTCFANPPFQLFNNRPGFQQLLAAMLQKSPQQRPRINMVARHAWFMNANGPPIHPEVIERLRHLSSKNEAQLKVSEMMLDRFNLGSLQQLNEAFMAMDTDMSGTITANEAKTCFARMAPQTSLTLEDVDRILYSLSDSSGTISYRRFMAAMIRQQRGFSTTELWALFCQLDLNRDGVLDQREVMQVLRGMNYSEEDALSFLRSSDLNRDGRISFEELRRVTMGA